MQGSTGSLTLSLPLWSPCPHRQGRPKDQVLKTGGKREVRGTCKLLVPLHAWCVKLGSSCRHLLEKDKGPQCSAGRSKWWPCCRGRPQPLRHGGPQRTGTMPFVWRKCTSRGGPCVVSHDTEDGSCYTALAPELLELLVLSALDAFGSSAP